MRNTTILACVVLLAACTTVPPGPRVMVLPGAGKSFDQFQTDDAVCRQWASQQAGTTAQAVSGQSTLTGAAVGTLLGAGLGAAIGAAAGHPGVGAAVGAGGGDTSAHEVQRRYDNAYQQCMYAKGNQIPVSAVPAARRSPYLAPPPPPPPPPAAALPPGVA